MKEKAAAARLHRHEEGRGFMMERAAFTPELVSGHAMVDAQHQELIDNINRLYDAVEQGNSIDEALSTLGFLAQYTMFHFGSEEKLMRTAEYPQYEAHKAAHDAFVETVKGLYDELSESGVSAGFADRVEDVVTKWLVNHILGMDKQMIVWLREHGE